MEKDNQTPNEKKRKLIICSMVPRSQSSILYRVIINMPNIYGIFEPLRCIKFYESGDRKKDEKNFNTIEDLENRIEEIFKQDSQAIVFWKESFILFPSKKELLNKFSQKYDCRFIHLARHPKLVANSWNNFILKCMKKNNKEIIDPKYTEDFLNRGVNYVDFLQLLKENKGYNMDSSLFVQNPKEHMTSLCNYLGLEFKEEYLQFEPLINNPDLIPYRIFVYEYAEFLFHNMLHSTKIDSKKCPTLEEVNVPKLEGELNLKSLIYDWEKEEKDYFEFKKLAENDYKTYFELKDSIIEK